MITKAFTCTGPYAILILLGIKRVENRSAMPAPAKGRCAISCSRKFCAAEYGEFVRCAAWALEPADFETIPAWAEVKDWPGKIVGCCDYAGRTHLTNSPDGGAAVSSKPPYREHSNGGAAVSSKPPYREHPNGGAAVSSKPPYREYPSIVWDEGYGCWWELSEVVAFDRPIPCRGNVGMWQMPTPLAAEVTAADRLAQSVGSRVATAADAAAIMRLAVPLAGEREGFFVLPLDGDRRVLAPPDLVSLGTSSVTTVVQPGEVFGAALKAGATAVVVAHNHPSGDTTPSAQDRELTTVLRRLGEVLGVAVLDHLVIGGETFASISN